MTEQISTQLEVYQPYREQLAIFKKENETIHFDYEDKDGNKEARSHVYSMRQGKSAVEKARKDAKAESLEYGRKIDAEAKEIISEIEQMIDVHQSKLDEIEQREKDRILAIENRIEKMDFDVSCLTLDFNSDELKKMLKDIKEISIDDSFEEFANKASMIKDRTTRELESAIETVQRQESEQAELEQLRQEKEAREIADREEKLKAQARAEAERESKQREKDLKAKAAKDKKDAAEKAERAALELKLEKESAERQRAESEKREADLKAENARLEKEAAEREVQTKKVQNAIDQLYVLVSKAEETNVKTIELKTSTAKILLKQLEK